MGNGVVLEQIAEGCSARELCFPASLLSLINKFSNPRRAELPLVGISIPRSVALWSQGSRGGVGETPASLVTSYLFSTLARSTLVYFIS